jgi:phage shock protein A
MSDFDWLERYFKQSRERDERIMAEITKLGEAVAGLSSSVDAAVTEIGELKAKITELEAGGGGTPTQAEVDAVTSTVEADAAKLMAAKTA